VTWLWVVAGVLLFYAWMFAFLWFADKKEKR